MDVSIIIVNYNTLHVTSDCIESIFRNTEGLEFEVILVDNASSDGSKDYFAKDRRITYVYMNDNLGFGKANNLGLSYAKGRNILFLNSDTLIVDNAVKILSDYLDSHEDVGICGANLYSKEMMPVNSYGMFYHSILTEFDGLLRGIPSRLLRLDRSEFNDTGSPKQVKSISGADLMIKKRLLDEFGGFNPVFFMYYEDTELNQRINSKGYKSVSVPSASIIHFGGASTGNISPHLMAHARQSQKEFYRITHKNKLKILVYNTLTELRLTIARSKERYRR